MKAVNLPKIYFNRDRIYVAGRLMLPFLLRTNFSSHVDIIRFILDPYNYWGSYFIYM